MKYCINKITVLQGCQVYFLQTGLVIKNWLYNPAGMTAVVLAGGFIC
ncbi:hypothetical protein Dthio_PD1422 [Desulfonatronospira thiodismutans ASO3-1]|uniref:Uncharacterized protein n=1 Tax=Desulfonatronospira thiodismutans ASO3-1 TaxID=555779 RepID=D6STR6_9BACT|nr:hypothetical protein Dthio_PD1422 [Desulfonatronospira thiodismutans ASO3-1]